MPTLPLLSDFGDVPEPAVLNLLKAIISGAPLTEQGIQLIRQAALGHADKGVQRLLPLIADSVDLSSIGNEYYQAIKRSQRQREIHFTVLHRLALMVTQDFEQHGIEPMFLKGFPLALAYYEQGIHRPMGDLDVAVRPQQFHKAVERLLALGFVTRTYTSDSPTVIPPNGGLHALTFDHPNNRQSIDLHYHVLSASVWPGADDGFWQKAQPLPYYSGALTLAPEHHVVHACLHGYSRTLMQLSVRWILDVHVLIKATGDRFRWDLLEEEATRHRCGSVLAATLGYLRLEMGLHIPEDLLHRLATGRMHSFDRAYFHLVRDILYTPSIKNRFLIHWYLYQRLRNRKLLSPLGFFSLLQQKCGYQSLSKSLFHIWNRRFESARCKRKRSIGLENKIP